MPCTIINYRKQCNLILISFFFVLVCLACLSVFIYEHFHALFLFVCLFVKDVFVVQVALVPAVKPMAVLINFIVSNVSTVMSTYVILQ